MNSLDADIDLMESSSEISSTEEELFFNKQIDIVQAEEHSKWNDSEENEENLRKEYKLEHPVIWKDNAKKERPVVKKNKLQISYKNKYLKINNNIKLAKISQNNIVVLISTYNDIYIYDDLKNNKKFKAINLSFNICDFDFVGDKIVFITDRNGIIKEFDLKTMEFTDILKGAHIKNKKIVFQTKLFLLAEKLQILDHDNYNTIYQFNENIIDFCISDFYVITLNFDKTISFYDILNNDFLFKKFLDEKFFITKILCLENYIFVCLEKGVKIFDANFIFIKEILDFCIDNVASSDNFLVFFGNGLNELRIVNKKNLNIVPSFPYSNMNFKHIKNIFFIENECFFSHSSYLSKIKLS
ncbi:hypothetical protein GVAV_001142 [Gurleya vavrai]